MGFGKWVPAAEPGPGRVLRKAESEAERSDHTEDVQWPCRGKQKLVMKLGMWERQEEREEKLSGKHSITSRILHWPFNVAFVNYQRFPNSGLRCSHPHMGRMVASP